MVPLSRRTACPDDVTPPSIDGEVVLAWEDDIPAWPDGAEPFGDGGPETPTFDPEETIR